MELAGGILTDSKRCVGIGTEKSDESFNDPQKVTDETHNWEMRIASEETNSAIVAIFLALKIKEMRPTESSHARTSCRER